MTPDVQPGDWIEGPFWEGAVQVVDIQKHPDHGHDLLTVHPTEPHASRTYILTQRDWAQVRHLTHGRWGALSFDADPVRFRLGIEAQRLRLAHSIDPYAALNASRIDPLPHQFEAVYEHLLSRPVVRALLAHDAGAGKTIMAGLLLKELKRRQGVKRALIVAPAGLTGQWRRELLTKFGEDFTIISRQYMQDHRLDSLDVWRATDFAITSIDFARQKIFRRALEGVEWDMVIVDEAHKMAAYTRPNGSVQKTQAYELGEVLSRRATHFLLMTATPHKGDPDNYRLLITLVNEQWGEATQYTSGGANPVVLRRTKEEMRTPDGAPLYPRRVVEPLDYNLSHREGALLEAVQKFIVKRYEKAKSANKQSAAFALVMLERRLASTPYALRESLKRMRARTLERLQIGRGSAAGEVQGDWGDWEDLSEDERWEREAQAEEQAVDLVSGRKQLERELRQIDALLADAEAIIQQGSQQKIVKLRQACDLWVGEHGEQLIIFTEFKDTLDYLLDRLAEWGYSTTQIHGGMALKERRQAEKDFWAGKAQVLVATEAAGEGINLQCCHVMVNFDIPWNPCRLEQRMGRIHRYGQKADTVYIFNMIAANSMEGEVKRVLLEKMDQMREDLGDKVFDVVGNVIWSQDLRAALERVALGERAAVEQAKQIIDMGGNAAKTAIEAERRITITSEPLDLANFRRKQATFRAHRLSPETSERFFRQTVPFLGGALKEFTVGDAPVFEVMLPPALRRKGRPDKLTLSFWAEACTDDETESNAVLFIAPGHWLFEALLAGVIERCRHALAKGCVFFDLQPEDSSPYLVWFIKSHIRDGLDRRVCDLLAAVKHRADQERVIALPTEVLDAFGVGEGADAEDAVRQVNPMLQGRVEVIDQCVGDVFMDELAQRRIYQKESLARDWRFLKEGLTALHEHLSMEAVEAYAKEKSEEGDRLLDRSSAVEQRLHELEGQMTRASHLLMLAPEVLGVAVVAPAPVQLIAEHASGFPMKQDFKVEADTMQAVMEYERAQGRFPRDVHEGNSWDIESCDAEGVVLRYIEVKGRGPKRAATVEPTDPEWEAARRLGDQYWLYIVRLEDGMMVRVQNPYAKLQAKKRVTWEVRINDAAAHGEVEYIDIDQQEQENPPP